MKLSPLRFNVFLVISSVIVLSSCNKATDGIPSYIRIDTIGLITQPAQGTASHKITDAWIYFGDELIGAFEMPVVFPVLKSGNQTITILAGIKSNGIAATRIPYPFYQPIVRPLMLTPGKITLLDNLTTTYKSNTVFAWHEHFDGSSLSVDTTRNSNAALRRTSDAEKRFRYQQEPNLYSAYSTLSGDTLLFECASIQLFSLPRNETPVFLELNYKTNNTFTVGFYEHLNNQVSQHPVLNVNPSAEWNKIYVNLTPTLAFSTPAARHKIFIGFVRDQGTNQATVYFDNLKLLHF